LIPTYKNGDIIDERYLVVDDKKGGGGFGRVLSVHDLQGGGTIALKYCTETDEEQLKRFKREVRIMENIDHENVVKVLDSNVGHVPPYFTMPLAQYSVANIIPELQNNRDRAIEVFEAICKGINAIHISGHTHRDIKPENALVYDGGKIVVSDLGLAKMNERDTTVLTRASVNMGTYDYMPPEQMIYGGTRDLDHRGDVFQLGKTLYHLVSGQRPTVMNPNAVPTGVWYVIQKATRQNPEERFQSVNQMLDALQGVKIATDPAVNPTAVLAELVSRAESDLVDNKYDPQTVSQMIQLIYSTDDEDEFIGLFHKLPDALLPVYANHMATEFEPVLIKYSEAIDKNIGGYAFSFADGVARKMQIIYSNATSPNVKRYALVTVLEAAVQLNRFAAMGVFDQILQSVSKDEDAYAIIDGLRDHIHAYSRLYDRIPKKELHPAIQLVWDECSRR